MEDGVDNGAFEAMQMELSSAFDYKDLIRGHDSDSDSDEGGKEDKEGDIQDEQIILGRVRKCAFFAGLKITEAYQGERVAVGLRVCKILGAEDIEKPSLLLGTIVDYDGRKTVNVQWDTETDENSNSDMDMQDLWLYDNAQIGVEHINVSCDSCDTYPLRGIRWKCLDCPEYDLCTPCYMKNEHYLQHRFERIQSIRSKGVEVPARENARRLDCTGIFKSDKVTQRGKDLSGTVVDLSDKRVNAFMCDAVVKMKGSETTRRFCVGREGKSELCYVDEGYGIYYYDDHLPLMKKSIAKEGTRVVRGSSWSNDNEDKDGGMGGVGTVINQPIESKTEKSKNQNEDKPVSIDVQWDNGNFTKHKEKDGKFSDLRMFDNRQTGVRHLACCDVCNDENSFDIILTGIRWKCITCDDYNLCTECYMSDKHDEHNFYRIVEPNAKRKKVKSRSESLHIDSHGIFKGAVVRKFSEKKACGIVERIRDCKMNKGRAYVIVEWDNDSSVKEKREYVELKHKSKGLTHYLYPDHLPVLGNDTRGYICLRGVGSNKKVEVNLWYGKSFDEKPSFKPKLYLIFANQPGGEKNGDDGVDENTLDEIIDFSKKWSCYCHHVGGKMLFYHNTEGQAEVFVHQTTEKNTIQTLVNKGFWTFHRGEAGELEEEIDYFLRMAKTYSGENMLPVIISLGNGGLRTNILENVKQSKIPIVCFKKQSKDVSILLAQEYDWFSVQMTEYCSNLKYPWTIVSQRCEEFYKGMFDKKEDPEKIARISDIQYEPENLVSHVCHLLLGVALEEKNRKKNIFGKDTATVIEALCIILLREGKWRLPKENIEIPFSKRAIEFVYGEDLTSDFRFGLWKELQDRSRFAYTHPILIEKDLKENTSTDGQFEDSSDSDSTIVSDSSDESDEDIQESPVVKPESEKEKTSSDTVDAVCEKKKAVSVELSADPSEMYGLIFYALLKKEYYFGAKQLIETGCIRIPQILVGCLILQDAENDRRTGPTQKDKLRKMNKIFTQQAIRITSCIHDEDKKHRHDQHKDDQQIFHIGRLLLNHGYLEDAIKTQNKTFLENSTIKEILNKMWYGEEELSLQKICLFLFLALVHPVLLLFLMVTIGTGPSKRLYKQYSLPFVKVFINLIGFVILLCVYAYMLLFNFSENLSYLDFIITGWMISFFIDEVKQLIVAMKRRKWKSYISDWWNGLDWLSIITYTSGMLCKIRSETGFKDAAKSLLVFAFIMLSIRILNMFCMSEILGPKLVIIRKMFRDTFAFMVIMAVIMICYNVSSYALIYPNSEFTFATLEAVMSNGYWMLFGELNLETWNLAEPDCSFNYTVYQSGTLPRCPSKLGLIIAPYLKVLYGMIAVILMLNLLIAMYSDTFQKVEMESEFYWSELQIDFLEEYSVKSIFPIHMQSLTLVALIIHCCLWFLFRYLTSKMYSCCATEDNTPANKDYKDLHRHPLFVRAFLYDTNFDLRLNKTREAEETGALKAKGEMDVWNKDKISMLKRQIESQGKKQEKQIEKNNQAMMKKLKKLKEGLDEIKSLILKERKEKHMSESEKETESESDQASDHDNEIFDSIYGMED